MATKNYMINDKWLDLDKQNIVELQSVDGVLDSMKVNGSEIVTPSGKITITENGTDIDIAQYALADVNVEGGGGSSDFSTAEVTIIVESGLSDGGGLNGGIANLSEGYGFLKNGSIITMAGALAGETIIATAILIEGEAIYNIVGGIVGNTTGGVSYDSENDTVKVVGDGSITITFNQ